MFEVEVVVMMECELGVLWEDVFFDIDLELFVVGIIV